MCLKYNHFVSPTKLSLWQTKQRELVKNCLCLPLLCSHSDSLKNVPIHYQLCAH